jgi:transposase
MMPAAFSGRVYLAVGSTDMRKAINGLSILVEQAMDLDPFSGDLFVFCNRKRTIVKILYWDHNGFCLWHKRL